MFIALFSLNYTPRHAAQLQDTLNGDPAPANLATGKTPFGSSEFGAPKHLIIHANDGQYGNAHSWINGVDPAIPDVPFIGIDLGAAPINVNRIAFGRSNVLAGDVCGGVCVDRNLGLYKLQYTRVPNPTAGLVTTGNATTGWADIGTLNNTGAGGTNFGSPHQRHLYEFYPVTTTGLRLIVPIGTAIDEIELYNVAEPVPTLTEWGIFFLIMLLAGAAFLRVRRAQPTSVY